ncbi:MAG: hypothetical protein ACYCPS_05050 [Candidatus Saccharimonadales bacterium]
MSVKKQFNIKKKSIEVVLPSSLSAVLAVVISIVINLAVLFINRYRPGRLTLNNLTNKSHLTLTGNYLTGSLTQNIWVKRLPVIFCWLVLLVLIYLLLADAGLLFKSKMQLKRFLLRSLLRLVVAIIWVLYIYYFFDHILAYVAKIDIVSTTASNVWAIVGYIIIAILISSTATQINVVFLRLVNLKTRVIKI